MVNTLSWEGASLLWSQGADPGPKCGCYRGEGRGGVRGGLGGPPGAGGSADPMAPLAQGHPSLRETVRLRLTVAFSPSFKHSRWLGIVL